MTLKSKSTRKGANGGGGQGRAQDRRAQDHIKRARDRRGARFDRRSAPIDRRGLAYEADDNLRDSVIMFIDIVGASEVSNYLSPAAYKDFVLQFQRLFAEICRDHFATTLATIAPDDRLFSARGDEGILMIYPKMPVEKMSGFIDDYIQIALELKRRWVFTDINRRSIRNGIVPIDLAIGIHVGQIYLAETVEDGEVRRRPEGYTINLAKRVEAFSRNGETTHIFVSETAHGLLNRLADEKTYIFGEPHSMTAKGFSRPIRTFEVKHHFLPVNWTNEVAAGRSPFLLRVPSPDELDLLIAAHRLNPTNVWLAEECIRSVLLHEFAKLPKAARTNPARLAEAYKVPLEIISYLEQGDQRDPGIVVIKAHVHRARMEFNEEQRCYIEAKDFDRFVPVLDWYHARSLGLEVWHEIGGEQMRDDEIRALDAQTLTPRKGSRLSAASLRDKIREAGALLERSAETARWAAWIKFAYGRELVMWGGEAERERGIAELLAAADLLEEVRVAITEERRLAKVRTDPRIQALARD
jgi:class 3 adenylate cyclase